MTAPPVVSVVDDAGVRVIGLDRRAVHNALNEELVLAVVAALRNRPESTRCVVIHGHGPSFCAGGDRSQGIANAAGETSGTLEALQEITRQLRSPDVLTVAAVEGWAIGGGAEIAVACDVIVAAADASFRFPEVELDAHATGGATWLLPRTVGLHRANLLLLTGRSLPAAEAETWGLVAEVVEHGHALERAQQLARAVAAFPAGSVASLKRSLHETLTDSLESALRNEVRSTQPRLAAGGFIQPERATEN